MRRTFQMLPREDVLVALSYFAVGLGLQILELSGRNPPHIPAAAGLMITILSTAAITLRRQKTPVMLTVVAAAVAISAATGGSTFMYFLMFEWFFSATLYASKVIRRVAAAIAVALVAAVSIYAQWESASINVTAVVFMQATMLCMIPIWWANNIASVRRLAAADRRRAEAEAEASIRAERLLAAEKLLASHHEKTALARDLHDMVASRISAIAMQSATGVDIADTVVKDKVLASIREGSLEALREMRAMIQLLTSNDAPAAPTRGQHRDRFLELVGAARASGVEVKVEDALEPSLDETAEDLYLIAQEALTNVLKHAPKSSVSITLSRTAGKTRLTVVNRLDPAAPHTQDGDNLLAEHGSGHGLANMLERAKGRGGSFSAGPMDAGLGWSVSAEIPDSDAVSTLNT
ncbi:sensor histidine kinase [Paenarthrobacter nitroguajacolicus]|uniref:sensor histidine kinase n=1 Tax=Paenarthrobacter nitroguajacolicus TaxID=211146 RepID=UPI003AE62FA2